MEDNPADAFLVREALESHGVQCELTVIADGEQAIEFIENLDAEQAPCPDLVIVDLNLPKKPGREVVARMRASLQCGHVPVVVFTSSDSQRDKDDSVKYGASAYVRKPSRLAEFLQLGSVFKDFLNKDA